MNSANCGTGNRLILHQKKNIFTQLIIKMLYTPPVCLIGYVLCIKQCPRNSILPFQIKSINKNKTTF